MTLAVIRGPYQRSALYIIEPEFIAYLSQLGKFIRVNKTDDG
jgi:hypothetical protein